MALQPRTGHRPVAFYSTRRYIRVAARSLRRSNLTKKCHLENLCLPPDQRLLRRVSASSTANTSAAGVYLPRQRCLRRASWKLARLRAFFSVVCARMIHPVYVTHHICSKAQHAAPVLPHRIRADQRDAGKLHLPMLWVEGCGSLRSKLAFCLLPADVTRGTGSRQGHARSSGTNGDDGNLGGSSSRPRSHISSDL